jgi:hypothetical protein
MMSSRAGALGETPTGGTSLIGRSLNACQYRDDREPVGCRVAPSAPELSPNHEHGGCDRVAPNAGSGCGDHPAAQLLDTAISLLGDALLDAVDDGVDAAHPAIEPHAPGDLAAKFTVLRELLGNSASECMAEWHEIDDGITDPGALEVDDPTGAPAVSS